MHIFTGRVYYHHTLYCTYAWLKANDPMTTAEMRDILLKLAHRLIVASWKQAEVHPDRLYLYTTILRQLGLYKDARELLDTESGRFVCARNLSCDYLRREIMKAGGWQMEEGDIAEQRIVEKRSVIYTIPIYLPFSGPCRDRNWLEFASILDATFLTSTQDQSTPPDLAQRVEKTRGLFTKVAEEDGSRDRAAWLGLLELERLGVVHQIPPGM